MYGILKNMDLKSLRSKLKAASGGSRLEILRFLKRRRSATVSDVAEGIGRSVQTASDHLAFLALHGIVKRRQRGKYVSYRLSLKQEPPVKDILKLL